MGTQFQRLGLGDDDDDERRETTTTTMKPNKSWVSPSQSNVGVSNATSSVLKPPRKPLWFVVVSLMAVVLLIDCWWNERIWSMNVSR